MPDAPAASDAALRRRAVAVAGYRGDLDAARAALHDPEPAVRATALGALARLDDLRAADLLAALADGDAAVRRRACEEAARAPAAAGGAVGAALVAALRADGEDVAEAAAFALGELDPPAPGSVEALAVAATSHPDVLVREASAAALGSLGDPAGLDAVLAACTDVATVRRRAVLALAAFDDERVEAALRTLSEDRDRQVRQAAEDLLREP